MEVNKVVYNGDTLLDLTSDTVTPQTLLSGATAHAANGQSISGTVDLNGKADKVANATAGNFAGLDASGNLTDSGKSASDFDNVWLGTRAEHTAAESAGTLPETAIIGIEDEYGSVVQSDWNQTDSTADDYIKNKPSLGTSAALDVASSGDASSSQVVKGNDTRLSDARTPTNHASDKVTTLTGYTKSISETLPISTFDTLNKALAKLENAIDSGDDIIDDEHISIETTYSSAKIEDMFSLVGVTWEGGTDEQIIQALASADAGRFSPANYWAVGDSRTFSLSAISPSTGVDETQPAQDVEMTIVHLGLYKDANDKTVNAIVHLKNSLATTGKINTANTNSGSWDSCPRRTWCNGNFYNAIPSSIRSIFKQFKTVTAKEQNSSELTTSLDYFALPAEKEIFGVKTYSTDAEAAVLTQWDYYKTSANRIKKVGTTALYWFLRSPRDGNTTSFCCVSLDGTVNEFNANQSNFGIAPFGCI